MYCANCGKKLMSEDYYCSKCGSPVDRQGLFTQRDETDFDDTMLLSKDEIKEALARSERGDVTPSAVVEAPATPRAEERVQPMSRAEWAAAKEARTPPRVADYIPLERQSVAPERFETIEPTPLASMTPTEPTEPEQVPAAKAAEKMKEGAGAAMAGVASAFSSLRNKGKAAKEGRQQQKQAKPPAPTAEQNEAQFKHLFVGIIAFGVIIGLVLGLMITKPWKSAKAAELPPTAQVEQIEHIDTY